MNMITRLITLISLSGILMACGPSKERQGTFISEGMEYTTAIQILEEHGYEKISSQWAMLIPEHIDLQSFLVSENDALLIFGDINNGKVTEIVLYKNINAPKGYRSEETITVYKVEK